VKCGEYTERIFDHFCGRLSPEENEMVRAHLESCPRCAAQAEQWRELAERCGAAAQDLSAPGSEQWAREVLAAAEAARAAAPRADEGADGSGRPLDLASFLSRLGTWGWRAAAVILVGAGIILRKDVAAMLGHPYAPYIVQVEGEVQMRTGDTTQPAAPGRRLWFGGEIRTTDARSRVLLAYPDGTRLELFGETAMTGGTSLLRALLNGKSVQLHGGTLRADVAGQPTLRPMRLSTPRARVEVLGTQLVLSTDRDTSRVEVNEGAVRFTRSADGRSVRVAAQEYAAAGTDKRAPLRSRAVQVAQGQPGPKTGQTPWWDRRWPYRAPYSPHRNQPATAGTLMASVDFSGLLSVLGVYGVFDADSVRVVSASDARLTEVPCTFVRAEDYDAERKAAGRVIWRDEAGAAGSVRRYHVYFDLRREDPKAPSRRRLEGVSRNLVSNAGFEDGMAGWHRSGKGLAVDSGVARSGTRSLRIDAADEDPGAVTARIPVSPGLAYRVEFWSKAQAQAGGNTCQVNVRALDADRNRLRTVKKMRVRQRAFDWQKSATLLNPGDGARFLELEFTYWKSDGSRWYDDVNVEIAGPPPLEHVEARSTFSARSSSGR